MSYALHPHAYGTGGLPSQHRLPHSGGMRQTQAIPTVIPQEQMSPRTHSSQPPNPMVRDGVQAVISSVMHHRSSPLKPHDFGGRGQNQLQNQVMGLGSAGGFPESEAPVGSVMKYHFSHGIYQSQDQGAGRPPSPGSGMAWAPPHHNIAATREVQAHHELQHTPWEASDGQSCSNMMPDSGRPPPRSLVHFRKQQEEQLRGLSPNAMSDWLHMTSNEQQDAHQHTKHPPDSFSLLQASPMQDLGGHVTGAPLAWHPSRSWPQPFKNERIFSTAIDGGGNGHEAEAYLEELQADLSRRQGWVVSQQTTTSDTQVTLQGRDDSCVGEQKRLVCCRSHTQSAPFNLLVLLSNFPTRSRGVAPFPLSCA